MATIDDLLIPAANMSAVFTRREHADREVSLPSYFAGPVLYDAKITFQIFLRRARASLIGGKVRGERIAQSAGHPMVGYIIYLGTIAGLIIGGVVGSIITALIVAVYSVAAAVGVSTAVSLCVILRSLDRVTRFIWGVQMKCSCGVTVRPYPAYRCPGCDSLHRDIRSGQRGIVVRLCRCHYRMPTLLLLGAVRLSAVCPNCTNPLPMRFGRIGEIAIPFFGGINVGKTQLMYMVTVALRELAELGGGELELIDDTQGRLDQIAASIAIDGSTSHTPLEPPRAYILELRLGGYRRRIYLFDAAGEMYYRWDTLHDLRYLEGARTLVFLVDPMASDAIWARLPPEVQDRLSGARSNAAEVELAYQQTREYMRQVGTKRKSTQLAFVVTKADLLAEVPEWEGGAAVDVIRRKDGLDMGDTVREATQGFRAVEFFQTAAITDGAGVADHSLEEFTWWLMKSEGITLRRR